MPGFLERLPKILAANSLRELVEAVVQARRKEKPVIFAMGAHVIKVGLVPILNQLIRAGIITCVATNGASIVHDVELACYGETSENVDDALAKGQFGNTQETGTFINWAINQYVPQGSGLGEAIGLGIVGRVSEIHRSHWKESLFGTCYCHDIPATVHVAIGTDVVHMHAAANGSLIGEGSMRDFRTLCQEIGKIGDGGVVINCGSHVIMPEVILKAFAWNLNRGVSLSGCVTANLDMIQGYRGRTQLVERVKTFGGRGYAITGHHEINIPILAGAILGAMREESTANGDLR